MDIRLNPSEYGASHNDPRMVVVHSMGEFILDPYPIHADDFLVKLGYSAHALVTPKGEVIITRDDDQGAYHAKGYNKDSLGIEFLVEGNHDYASFVERIKTPYLTDDQFSAGVAAVSRWVNSYEIAPNRVLRHIDISPGRKVDPGEGFPWERFKQEIFL